ncbi:GumC family protein [Neorhodopirellula lusitana]|uniref:GumC family protein n=1 Tax=Neorhodopirellula lusitana TaxID=445327 RepID=UPI00384B7459
MASFDIDPSESSHPNDPQGGQLANPNAGHPVEHARAAMSRAPHNNGPHLSPEQSPLWVDNGGLKFSSLSSYLEIPFIHKWLIGLCTALGLMSGWFAIIAWPRTYESEAKLMVRVGRESVSLDPTATTGATLMLQKTQEEEIVSALEVLNSRQVAEIVTDKIGADAILAGELPAEGPAAEPSLLGRAKKTFKDGLYNVLLFAGLKDDISNHELAVMRVGSSLWIHSPRKSNVIIVEAQAKSPQMAQEIVDQATKTFLDMHLQNAHTVGSFDFFQEQAEVAEQALNGLVDRRAEFMQDRKMVSIESSRALLQERLTGIDRDLVLATGQLEEAASSVKDLRTKYAGTEDEIVASKIAGSDSTWSGMRQQVYELEVAEQNLAANYTNDHPKLKRVRTQLTGAREILAELESERVDENRTPNPMKATLLEELQRQETRVVGLKSMIAEKKRQQFAMQKQTDDLLEDERELTQVDREIRMAETSLKVLQEKLEEARVISQLQSNKISNVAVFQPATLMERAVSPKKPALAAAFLLLGFTGGLGLSVLRQATSSSLRTSDDVENQLGCPVVASLPRISRVDSPRLNDQKRLQESCQTLVSDILLGQRRAGGPHGRSVGIIGVDEGAGASTLAMKLATASATDCRLRTVLVDGDTRQRSVSRSFKLNGKPGLVELVSGNASHDECLQSATGVPMQLISSAADSCDDSLNNNAPEIVQSLQAYLEDCDLLIVDLPAASQPDQAIAVAQHLDSVLVIVESEKTQSAAADRLLRRLAESDTEVIGVVLNKTRSYLPVWLRRCVGSQA